MHGLSGFEFLNHGTHSAIFNAIVCSDLTSHTVIQIDTALFFFQRFQSVIGLCALSHLILAIEIVGPTTLQLKAKVVALTFN